MKTLNLKIESYEINVPVFEKDGKNWAALKPLCDVLGVDSYRQITRVKASSTISYQHMLSTGNDGKTYDMVCIDIDHIGEWIFGINPNKVKPEVKERMLIFRRKLQAVLYAAVTGHTDPSMVESLVAEVKTMRNLLQYFIDKVQVLESELKVYKRFENADRSAAASRLAHQRWARTTTKGA